MPWLERLNDRNARKLAHVLRHNAAEAGELAQDRWQDFARSAGAIAGRTAHDVADYGRQHGAEVLREQAQRYAGLAQERTHDLRDHMRDRARRYAHAAGEAAGELVDYGRHESAVLAEAAAVQARRVGRAVKADPVPVIVGAIGIALVANLLFGRRR